MLQLWVKHIKFCHLGNELCPTNKNVLPLNAVTDINCRLNNLLADFSHYDSKTLSVMFKTTLCCVYFKKLRKKYIKPYYCKRPSMNKFVELMTTRNKREMHRLMLFTKFAFKKYLDTLLEQTSLSSRA